jgi:hypothetical protein
MALIAQEMVEMEEAKSEREVEKLPQDVSAAAFDRAFVLLMERGRPGSTTKNTKWTQILPATLYDQVASVRQPIRKRKKEVREAAQLEREKAKKQKAVDKQQRRLNIAAGGGVELLVPVAAAERKGKE